MTAQPRKYGNELLHPDVNQIGHTHILKSDGDILSNLCSINFAIIVFDDEHVTLDSLRQVRSYHDDIGAYANVWLFQGQLRWKPVWRRCSA